MGEWGAPSVQGLMREVGIPNAQLPTVHVVTFSIPRHNLSSRPQPPEHLTTILRVLQLLEGGPVGDVLFNHLVDSQKVERRLLVEVCNPLES